MLDSPSKYFKPKLYGRIEDGTAGSFGDSSRWGSSRFLDLLNQLHDNLDRVNEKGP